MLSNLRKTLNSSPQAIRDVAMALVPHGGRSAAGFITSIFLARGLGPAGMGQYALALSVSETIGALSELGIGQTALRYASLAFSRGEVSAQYSVLRWAFRVRVVLVAAMSVVVFLGSSFLAGRIWNDPGLVTPIRLILLLPLFGVLAYIPVLYFQSMRRFGMNAIVVSGQAALFVAGVLAIELLDAWSVGVVIGVSVLSAGIGAIVFLFLVPLELLHAGTVGNREPFWRLSLPDSLLKSSVDDSSANRFAFFMLVSKIIMLVTLRADVWLMGAFLSQSEIGLYNAASRFALPLSFVVMAVGTALVPRASSVGSRQELRSLLKRTIRGSSIVTALSCVYAVAVPFVAPWLFGDPFTPCIVLGQILCLGQCAVILTNPLALVGYNLGLARVFWMIHLAQLVLVLCSLLLFLADFGALAAAWTFLGSSVVGGILTAAVVWRSAGSEREGDDMDKNTGTS